MIPPLLLHSEKGVTGNLMQEKANKKTSRDGLLCRDHPMAAVRSANAGANLAPLTSMSFVKRQPDWVAEADSSAAEQNSSEGAYGQCADSLLSESSR